jgi:hypothetical protein
MAATTHALARPLATRGTSIRALLTCGILAGPLFVGGSVLHGALRDGFDIARHGVSLLLLGRYGWIQLALFEVAGLLALAAAVGARRVLYSGRARTWGPLLICGFGLGLIIGGLFAPDPAFGFPPGTPDTMAPAMSASGGLHALGFFVSMLSLIAGSFVFARRFVATAQRGLAVLSVACGVAVPLFVVASILMAPRGGAALIGVLAVVAIWPTAVSATLRAEAHDA